MTEEVKEEKEQKEPELSDVEQLAVKLGWNPDHEGGNRTRRIYEFLGGEKQSRRRHGGLSS